MLVGPPKIKFPYKYCKCYFLRFFCWLCLFFNIYGDNGSGNLNVSKTNKHFNTMKIHWVVLIRIHDLAICLLGTTALFIKDQTGIFYWKAVRFDNKIRLVAQLDHLVVQKNHQLLKPSNVWCEVCI